MVKNMNKKEFIDEIKEKLNFEDEQCIKINNIIEDTFLIGKKNKEKMIKRFIEELNVSDNQANEIYNTAMEIICSGINNKLKHPFKDLDKE